MSYDFRLFQPQPGVDPLVTAQSEPDETDLTNPGAPVATKEARKKAIADGLMKADPSLGVFQFGFDEIAKFEKISIEEARLRYRHIELNGPDGGPGIQIMLFDDCASLTVPYWHQGQKARTVIAQIWEYLKVMQHVSGYQIYDPQLECIVDLESDLERATNTYTEVVKRVWG